MDRLRLVRLPTRSAGEPNPMTIDRITLKELVEKGSDADLLREMIAFIASRMMELGWKGSPAPATASARPTASINATVTVSGPGRWAPAP